MKLLLPHRFKRVGAVISPLGFLLWVGLQKGMFHKLLSIVDENGIADPAHSPFYVVYVTIAFVSFFSFLGGIYMIAFSKEKIEDEMVKQTRLDSFQFAAVVQILCIIIGFLCMIIFEEPENDGGLLLFFIATIVAFWISFIARFNYILHIKFR